MSRGLSVHTVPTFSAKGAHSTGKSIFEFGFDFAEMFGHKVSSAVCSTPRRQLCDRFVNKGYTFRENLRSRMHTAEVCNIPLRQTAHRGVKIEIFTCLWLLLKGQSIENLLGATTSNTDERKDLKYKMLVYKEYFCLCGLNLSLSQHSVPNCSTVFPLFCYK